MIKSKIDARERALELAVEWRKAMPNSLAETTESMAENFAKFLIGDAELPEVTDDNAHIKELLEIANKSFDNSLKCNNDEIDCMFKGSNADVTSEVPCKSEAEWRMSDKVKWEQARVDAAISAMNGIIANSHDKDYRVRERYSSYDSWRKGSPNEIAKTAVAFADALIAELKKKR